VLEVDVDTVPMVESEGSGALLRADLKQAVGRDDVSAQSLAAGDSLEFSQLLERVDAHVGVRADAERDFALEDRLERREAVAEVRLRRRTEANAGARVGQEVQFPVVCVGCVHDGCAWSEAAGPRKKLDRAKAMLGEALLDLTRLLVGMHVKNELLAFRVAADLFEPFGRAGTNGMGRNSHGRVARAERIDLLQIRGDGLLAKAVEPAAGVRAEEEHEVDPRFPRGLQGGLCFHEPDVMKLTDRRVPRPPHLPIRQGVVLSNHVRGQTPGMSQHGISPGPKVSAFRLPAKGTLKGMTVRVDESRQREPIRHRREATPFRTRPGSDPGHGRGGHGGALRAGYHSGEMAARAVPAPLAQVPNALTVVRLALIPVFVALVLAADGERSWVAAAVFAVAGISDQVDGWLARRWRVQSQFGKYADPLADRLMIDAAVVLLWLDGRLPWVALAVILARDGLLVLGTPAAMQRGYDFSVSFLGKTATWVLYAALFAILITNKGADWPLVLFWSGVALAVVAAALYVSSAWRSVKA
jgi:CDP-diacylglycerol--glycerol-3-phosphate 3-phosphatidyltransferase